MGRIIIRNVAAAANPNDPLNPTSLSWDGFWNVYTGSPLLGVATAGPSFGRNASEATNPPNIAATLNGSPGRDYDGINDQLVISGPATDYMTDNIWTGYVLFKAGNTTPINLAEPYYEDGILTDASGSFGLSFSEHGFCLFRHSLGWKSVRAAMPIGEFHVATFRWDASTNTIAVGIDGPPNCTNFCTPLDLELSFRTISEGKNFSGTKANGTTSARFEGQIYESGMRKVATSDVQFSGLVASINSRYSLSLSQPSNFEAGTYDRAAQPAPSGYTGTVKTSSATNDQRDGAKLHFFNGAYYLLGGWHSSPIWPGDGSSLTTNQIWKSTNLTTWTLVQEHVPGGSSTRWSPRHTFGSFIMDGYLYVVGGDQYVSGVPDVWRTDGYNDCQTWTKILDRGPWDEKVGYCVGKYGNEIHVLGGIPVEQSVFYAARRSHYVSYDKGFTWHQLSDMPFATSYQTTLVEHQGLLFSIGGNAGGLYTDPGQGATRIATNDVWAWNGSKWRKQCSNAPWAGRYWNDCIEYDDKLWVMTGRINDTTDVGDAWWSSDLGQTWTEVTAPWSATHADGVCATEADGIVMASGFGINLNVYTLKKI